MWNQSDSLQSRQFLLKKFVLAQIVDYVPQTKVFKICILSKQQALKAIINTDQQMTMDDSDNTVIYVP